MKDNRTKLRRDLRKRATVAERALWRYLNNHQLNNKKFRRQHSIDNFIVDFYCPESKLAIELDGNVHQNDFVYSYDKQRDSCLNMKGIKVLHFENKFIFNNLEWVLTEIKKFL